MTVVNVHEAKSQLARLLEAVERGEEVIIARSGQPVAALVPYRPRRRVAPPGAMAGEIWIADDLDEPIDELFDVFQEAEETGQR